MNVGPEQPRPEPKRQAEASREVPKPEAKRRTEAPRKGPESEVRKPSRAPREKRIAEPSPVVEDIKSEWNGPVPSFLSFGAD
jgi:hypothetical protein